MKRAYSPPLAEDVARRAARPRLVAPAPVPAMAAPVAVAAPFHPIPAAAFALSDDEAGAADVAHGQPESIDVGDDGYDGDGDGAYDFGQGQLDQNDNVGEVEEDLGPSNTNAPRDHDSAGELDMEDDEHENGSDVGMADRPSSAPALAPVPASVGPPPAAVAGQRRSMRQKFPSAARGNAALESDLVEYDDPEPEKNPDNPDSKIVGEPQDDGTTYSYTTGGGAKHVEVTESDGKVVTTTTGATYIKRSKRGDTKPGEGFVKSHDHYGRSSGQRGRHQMVESHNTPSMLGYGSGGKKWRNGSISSPTYNSAVKQFDDRAITSTGPKNYTYETATKPTKTVKDLASDEKYLDSVVARLAKGGAPGWDRERIRRRLEKVGKKNAKARILQGETRIVRSETAKEKEVRLDPDYHAYIPLRAIDAEKFEEYQRDTGKEGSDHDDSDLADVAIDANTGAPKTYMTADEREAVWEKIKAKKK